MKRIIDFILRKLRQNPKLRWQLYRIKTLPLKTQILEIKNEIIVRLGMLLKSSKVKKRKIHFQIKKAKNPKNQHCIFQYYIGELGSVPKRSIASIRRYAKQVGADHIFTSYYSKLRFYPNHAFVESLRLYEDPYFDRYDKLLFLDADVFANTKENIFEKEIADVGMVDEPSEFLLKILPNGWFQYHERATRLLSKRFHYPYPTKKNGFFQFFNSGVMLWSRQARLKAREKFMDYKQYFKITTDYDRPNHLIADQDFFNFMFQYAKFEITDLSRYWNFHPHKMNKKELSKIHFLHLVDGKSKKDPKIISKLKNWGF